MAASQRQCDASSMHFVKKLQAIIDRQQWKGGEVAKSDLWKASCRESIAKDRKGPTEADHGSGQIGGDNKTQKQDVTQQIEPPRSDEKSRRYGDLHQVIPPSHHERNIMYRGGESQNRRAGVMFRTCG